MWSAYASKPLRTAALDGDFLPSTDTTSTQSSGRLASVLLSLPIEEGTRVEDIACLHDAPQYIA